MPNASVPAAGEAVPATNLNRRRLLLGLAAASAAAATATAAPSNAVAATPAENPELIALAADLPAIVDECLEAIRVQREIEWRWYQATPRAPDELTEVGTDGPYEKGQPGEAESGLPYGFLWRKGEKFPRRIVLNGSDLRWSIYKTKRRLRKAKKQGNAADYLDAEEELARLKKLEKAASQYEAKFADLKKKAQAEYDAASISALMEKLEKQVAAIMTAEDWTIEGLVIKAQALGEWDRVTGMGRAKIYKLAFKHGADWHGQIAASVLRHAKGGAA
ncbi:MAG: hypothetical protein E5W55_01575 [Mesorhizobium sp.]|nr:MAG: hypothetical protein E5W55_01575 [Mesorhizobium sp.]